MLWPGSERARCAGLKNSGTATHDCSQKINIFGQIYLYIHTSCIYLNIWTHVFMEQNGANVWYEYMCGATWWCHDASSAANSGTWTHRTLNTQKRLNTESTILILNLHDTKIANISKIFRISDAGDYLLWAPPLAWSVQIFMKIWNTHSRGCIVLLCDAHNRQLYVKKRT